MESNGESARRAQAKGQRRHRKFRGLTCANCRIKKVRCEGSQPKCKTCEIYHVECHYDKPPPLSQVVAMARQLQEAELVIKRLQKGDSMKSQGESPSNEEPDALEPAEGPETVEAPKIRSALPSQHGNIEIGSEVPLSNEGIGSKDNARDANGTSAIAAPQESIANDISIDEHGKICYYGPTSAVHEPVDIESPSVHSSTCASVSRRADVRAYLASYAREAAIWEDFALGNAAIQTGIPRQIMAKLLHQHWTWVAPMFMWVHRPSFMRDMTTGGRYYSEFLLLVLCAHAAKYQDNHHIELLLSRVRLLLGDAIQKPSSIPTVQALLQLSARELAQGSISQAWLYSGMAFRMAQDLGLQHNGPDLADLKGLSPIDVEVRKRLFWSCYFWDKAISLYTGRRPAVTELPQGPVDFMDDSAETEIWCPYFENSSPWTRLAPGQYPIMNSHAVSCFANSCKLSVIINDIIVKLYSRQSRAVAEVSLKDITNQLDSWRAQSPNHLRYEPDYLPTICPPPHIISQNLLYFATVILAHRPFWSTPAYFQVCITASQGMEKLLILLESTFGFENITYLMGYSIYTGASAILEEAKTNQGSAHPTIKTFLRALNGAIAKCPLLERSLHIIIKGLERAPVPRAVPNEVSVSAYTTATMNNYIPAFPFLDPNSPLDYDIDHYFNNSNFDAMATLDCYPELQIDLDELMRQAPP